MSELASSQTRSGPSAGWAAVVAFVAAVAALAWPVTDSPIAQDDFAFLYWAALTQDQPGEMLTGAPFFEHARPLADATWWLAEQLGPNGWAMRLMLAACAALALGVPAGIAAGRRGVLVGAAAVALVAMNGVVVDLLAWRAWVTTLGSLAALGVAMVVLSRPARTRWDPLLLGILGVVAAGFKEPAGMAIGLLVLGTREDRGGKVAGLVVIGAALWLASATAGKLDPSLIIEHLRFYDRVFGAWAAGLPVLLVLSGVGLFPALGLGLGALMPAPVGAIVFLGGAVWAMRRTPQWAAVAVAVWAIPMVGIYHSVGYVVEGWVVLLGAVLLHGEEVHPRRLVLAVGATMVLSVPSALEYAQGRTDRQVLAREQQAFLSQWQPPPATCLYRPDPTYSIGLDAIMWARQGAQECGHAPEGRSPAQVGPRSGIWADLVPDSGALRDGE